MSIELELQIASNIKTIPHPAQFKEWVKATLEDKLNDAELTIRIVDEEEITDLNFRFRKKNSLTNVLSFPYESPPGVELFLLGDIVICASVVEEESRTHKKELLAHWAHLIIHGVLHLLHYDHQTKKDAEEMEGMETAIMVKLGFAPPYGDTFIS